MTTAGSSGVSSSPGVPSAGMPIVATDEVCTSLAPAARAAAIAFAVPVMLVRSMTAARWRASE